MARLLSIAALVAFVVAGCAGVEDGFEDLGDGFVELATAPGGLINCPRTAWSLLHPESWVLDGVWIGGSYLTKELLIDSAIGDPESIATELRMELAAIANNSALGVDYGPDVLAAASDAQDWLARQNAGATDATAALVGSDIAEALRGSSFEAAVSCLDALARAVTPGW